MSLRPSGSEQEEGLRKAGCYQVERERNSQRVERQLLHGGIMGRLRERKKKNGKDVCDEEKEDCAARHLEGREQEGAVQKVY